MPRPRKPAEPAPPASSKAWVWIVVVGAVALAASAAGLVNDFAQDDGVLIEQNVRIHDLANWWQMVSSPFWPPPYNQDLYRPLTSLFLSLQWVLGGGTPGTYRVVSYALYAASAIGVLFLARRLLPAGVAITAALLFAAHPVHVEAVALGVGQNELLVALAAVFMTARYLDRRRRGELRPADWLLLGAVYLAACLTKEQGLVLPGLLLAAEAFLLRGAHRNLRSLMTGFGFFAVLGIGVLLVRQAVLGEVAGTFTAEALQGLSASGRALTMLQVVPQWTRLLLWPVHLQADYSPQEMVASSGFGAAELLGFAILVSAATAIWLARRRTPVVSFGVAWMAVTLLPVSNVLIPTGILLAERTLFLPSIGFVIAAGGVVAALWPRVMGATARRALLAACGIAVAAGVARSAERQRIWRNEALFSVRGVQDAPRSYRMQKAYGLVLFDLGERQLAAEAYQRALELAPPDQVWRVRNDLARRFWDAGENELAVEQLEASLALDPAQEETRSYLVTGYLALGRYADAAREADSAMARGGSPTVFTGLRRIADSAARVGAPKGAIRIRILTGADRRER